MATAGLTYDEVMAQSAQAKPQQGLVLDEAFDVIHQDDDKSEDEDFEEIEVEIKDDYVGRCTSVFVQYPRRVVVSILLITVLAMYATYLDNFSITVPSPYDWECPDDEYTLLRDAMMSAEDEADESKALTTRGDATFPFYYFYDSEPWNRDASCDGGIFTPQRLRAMCLAEEILTSNKEYQEDYCLLANGTCVTRSASVLQFFYDDATCSLLDQTRIGRRVGGTPRQCLLRGQARVPKRLRV